MVYQSWCVPPPTASTPSSPFTSPSLLHPQAETLDLCWLPRRKHVAGRPCDQRLPITLTTSLASQTQTQKHIKSHTERHRESQTETETATEMETWAQKESTASRRPPPPPPPLSLPPPPPSPIPRHMHARRWLSLPLIPHPSRLTCLRLVNGYVHIYAFPTHVT